MKRQVLTPKVQRERQRERERLRHEQEQADAISRYVNMTLEDLDLLLVDAITHAQDARLPDIIISGYVQGRTAIHTATSEELRMAIISYVPEFESKQEGLIKATKNLKQRIMCAVLIHSCNYVIKEHGRADSIATTVARKENDNKTVSAGEGASNNRRSKRRLLTRTSRLR